MPDDLTKISEIQSKFQPLRHVKILFQKTVQFNIIPLLNKLYLSYRSILRFAFEIMPDNLLKL